MECTCLGTAVRLMSSGVAELHRVVPSMPSISALQLACSCCTSPRSCAGRLRPVLMARLGLSLQSLQTSMTFKQLSRLMKYSTCQVRACEISNAEVGQSMEQSPGQSPGTSSHQGAMLAGLETEHMHGTHQIFLIERLISRIHTLAPEGGDEHVRGAGSLPHALQPRSRLA
jgi:hypothetical protein